MDSWGLVAIVMCCGLFAVNMNTNHKLKTLEERMDKLDRSSSSTH